MVDENFSFAWDSSWLFYELNKELAAFHNKNPINSTWTIYHNVKRDSSCLKYHA